MPFVGRMDDIWAAYYVQAKGCNVVFGKASVYQERNVHDLVRDMKQEYLGYENNLEPRAGPRSRPRVARGLSARTRALGLSALPQALPACVRS